MTIEEMQKSTEFQVFDRKSVRIDAKALESYKEDRKPVFKSSPSQFMTIIYSMEYDGELNGQLNGDVDGDVNGDVNGDVISLRGVLKDIYLIVLNNPGIKIAQVAELRGKSESTVWKQLNELTKKGIIEYRGSDKTGGYYVK